jgi:hsp70-interacting protein
MSAAAPSGPPSAATQNDPFSWLGLLKWSLAYTDGTSETKATPMSPEDKAFLEQVMKDGIVNEGERMTTILQQTTDIMELWKHAHTYTDEQETAVQVLLDELRFIVEQIDYARAFSAMAGLPFLLGCVGERQAMPRSTRLVCLGILATLCHNNPPVQKQLLELGAIGILSELFFQEEENANTENENTDTDGQLRARILQAISASVRSHDLAEAVYCQLEQAVPLLEHGLGVNGNSTSTLTTPTVLLTRALFFLRALVTSDTATRDRVRQFTSCICWTADTLLDNDNDDTSQEIREMALALLHEILHQKKSVNAVLSRKDPMVAKGVARVSDIRNNLTEQDQEDAAQELELWENLISLLARAEPDTEEVVAAVQDPNTLIAQ